MPSTGTAYSIWETPGRKLVVHFRRSALEWIDGRVKEAFQSIPKRGAETGGLLIGTRTQENGVAVVVVESAEPIACEHRSGPSFLLSEKDQAALKDQLRRLRSEGLVVVGLFRSHTRDHMDFRDLAPTTEDQQLIEAGVAGRELAFLLLRPVSAARTMGKVFCRYEGRMTRDGDFLPFPFESVDVSPPEPEPARPRMLIPADTPPRTRSMPLDLPPVRKRSNALPWIVGFGLAGALTGYLLVSRLPASTAENRPVAVELAADRVRNQLILRWNPNHPGLKDVQDAGLVVSDGGREHRYQLDHDQVMSGEMPFTPSSGDVTFSLEARSTAGRQARGVLLVIDPAR